MRSPLFDLAGITRPAVPQPQPFAPYFTQERFRVPQQDVQRIEASRVRGEELNREMWRKREIDALKEIATPEEVWGALSSWTPPVYRQSTGMDAYTQAAAAQNTAEVWSRYHGRYVSAEEVAKQYRRLGIAIPDAPRGRPARPIEALKPVEIAVPDSELAAFEIAAPGTLPSGERSRSQARAVAENRIAQAIHTATNPARLAMELFDASQRAQGNPGTFRALAEQNIHEGVRATPLGKAVLETVDVVPGLGALSKGAGHGLASDPEYLRMSPAERRLREYRAAGKYGADLVEVGASPALGGRGLMAAELATAASMAVQAFGDTTLAPEERSQVLGEAIARPVILGAGHLGGKYVARPLVIAGAEAFRTARGAAVARGWKGLPLDLAGEGQLLGYRMFHAMKATGQYTGTLAERELRRQTDAAAMVYSYAARNLPDPAGAVRGLSYSFDPSLATRGMVEGGRVSLGRGADFSTLVHEGMHEFFRQADATEQRGLSEIAGYGRPLSELTDAEYVDAQESAARAFERWLLSGGRESDPKAGRLMGQVARFMREVYPDFDSAIANTDALSPQARQAFGSVFRPERGTVGAPGMAEAPALAQGEKADPFYSHLERTAVEKLPNRGSAEQFRQTLLGAGVKPEEMEWTGTDRFLAQGGTIEKQALLDHISDNQVRVEEVTKGVTGYKVVKRDTYDYAIVDHNGQVVGRYYDRDSADVSARDMNRKDGGTKFDEWVLKPRGEDYRELLLTLPKEVTAYRVIGRKGGSQFDSTYPVNEYARAQSQFEILESSGYDATIAPVEGGTSYQSSHWEEPNVLAHVRFDTRNGPNGERVLHVAEIQSDWHQTGRRKGYAGRIDADEAKRLQAEAVAAREALDNALDEANAALQERIVHDRYSEWYSRSIRYRLIERAGRGDIDQDYRDILLPVYRASNEARDAVRRRDDARWRGAESVPDAPFKKTWHELALKRIFKYASDEGYDMVTWDTGATNADRYDLSKRVSAISVRYEPDGRYSLSAFRINGGEVHGIPANMSPDKLADVVGKDLADRIVADRNQYADLGGYTYKGDDLRVGGEGMVAFYDRMIPAAANKIVKRYGGKTAPSTISTDKGPAPVHAVRLTPEMRSSVSEQGFPLFQGEKADPFYSHLERTAVEKLPNRGSAEQFRQTLLGAGVKPEEMEWTGTDRFLAQGGTIEKQALLDHISENQVRVEEVTRGVTGYKVVKRDTRPYYAIVDHNGQVVGRYHDQGSADVFARDMNRKGGGTKFDEWVLKPRGKDYRELLLTLPSDTGQPYRSSHWDEPNVLAHVRFDTRKGPSREHVLHIAEIQSDWHQTGRRVGYEGVDGPTSAPGRVNTWVMPPDWRTVRYRDIENIPDLPALDDLDENTPGDTWLLLDEEDEVMGIGGGELTRDEFLRWIADDEASQAHAPSVPNAPFKKTWHELALKRIFKYASDEGYDMVTWDTGATNADRYDLSRQVDSITVLFEDGDKYSLRVTDLDGNDIPVTEGMTADKLADTVGKDLANRIVADRQEFPRAGRKTYTGDDLKVGGEGMVAFYDRMLPAAADKIVKRYGGKTVPSTISTNKGPAPVHAVRLTPEMRSSVSEQGFPLFQGEKAPRPGSQPEGQSAILGDPDAKEPWQMGSKEFVKAYPDRHIDVRSRGTEGAADNRIAIENEGFRKAGNVNVLPSEGGTAPYDLRAGDIVYAIRAGGVDTKRRLAGGFAIAEGYRPLRSESVVVKEGDKSLHYAFVRQAIEDGKQVPAEILERYPELQTMADALRATNRASGVTPKHPWEMTVDELPDRERLARQGSQPEGQRAILGDPGANAGASGIGGVPTKTSPVRVLHGTASNFEQFDGALRGQVTGSKSAQRAFWFTDDPETAKAYAIYAAEDGPIVRLMAMADEAEKRAQRTGLNSDWDKVNDLIRQAEEIDTNPLRHERRANSKTRDVEITGDFLEVDAHGKTPQELADDADIDSWLDEQIRTAIRLRKDGVVFHNLDDAVGIYDRPATHYAVFDKKNIRTIGAKPDAEAIREDAGRLSPQGRGPETGQGQGGPDRERLAQQGRQAPDASSQEEVDALRTAHGVLQRAVDAGQSPRSENVRRAAMDALREQGVVGGYAMEAYNRALRQVGGSGTIPPKTGGPGTGGVEPERLRMADVERRAKELGIEVPANKKRTFAEAAQDAAAEYDSILGQLERGRLGSASGIDPTEKVVRHVRVRDIAERVRAIEQELKSAKSAKDAERTMRLSAEMQALQEEARGHIETLYRTSSENGYNLAFHRYLLADYDDAALLANTRRRARRDLTESEVHTITAQAQKGRKAKQEQAAQKTEVDRLRDDLLRAMNQAGLDKSRTKAVRDRIKAASSLKAKLRAIQDAYDEFAPKIEEVESLRGDVEGAKAQLTHEKRSVAAQESALKRRLAKLAGEMADTERRKAEVDAKISRAMADVERVPWWEELALTRKAGLLTNVKTVVRNAVGNAVQAAREEGLRPVDVLTDRLIFGLSPLRRWSDVSEAPQAFLGRDAKAFDAWFKTTKEQVESILKEGVAPDLLGRYDARREARFFATRWAMRFQGIQDTPWRVRAYYAALYDQARAARKAGDVRSVHEIVMDPTDAMRGQAEQAADFAVFMEPNAIASWLNAPGMPDGLRAVLDIVFPFKRVPSNIGKRMIPGAELVSAFAAARNEVKATGSVGYAARIRLARAVNDTAILSALWWYGFQMAHEGRVTTRPQSDKERDTLSAYGQPSLSIQLGGNWYRLTGTHPFANAIAAGASTYGYTEAKTRRLQEDEKAAQRLAEKGYQPEEVDGEPMSSALWNAFIDTINENPFMKGPRDLVNMTRGESSATQFLADMAVTYIPFSGAARDFNELTGRADTVLRERGDGSQLASAAMRRFGTTQDLPAVVDPLGEPVPRSARFGDIFSTRKATDDPLRDELRRLGVRLGSPDKQGVTAEENEDRKMQVGGALKTWLSGYSGLGYLKAYSDEYGLPALESEIARVQRLVARHYDAIKEGKEQGPLLDRLAEDEDSAMQRPRESLSKAKASPPTPPRPPRPPSLREMQQQNARRTRLFAPTER